VSSIALALLGPGLAGAVTPTWHSEALDGPASTLPGHTGHSVGAYNASVVYHGQLHVFTLDGTGSLRHAWWDGSWHFETVDGPGSAIPGHSTDQTNGSIAAVVYQDQLHLFSYDATRSSLRHDWWDGTRWRFGTPDGAGSPWPGHTSDKVGTDTAVLVYHRALQVFSYDTTRSSLRHDWWDGARWHFETLDGAASSTPGASTDRVGTANAATVFGGQLHVLTHDATTASLRHDWWDGHRWNFETLDGAASSQPGHSSDAIGEANSIVVYGNHLHVFTDDTVVPYNEDGSLRHDWWDGVRWHFQTLDPGTACGASCGGIPFYGRGSVAVVYSGQLHVFSDELTIAALHPNEQPAWLQHDWWDGSRWHHGQLFSSDLFDRGFFPDNAAVVYNNQLHVFSRYLGGVGHAWLG
jgi:hypothetical protein